jgi:uncharacterized protein YlxP (DUF503 family)
LTIGVCSLEIHLPGSHSLKDRRRVVRRVKDLLRSRHNVAVVELDEHADLWQRAGLMIVSLATNRDVLQRLFESVQREAETHVPGEVVVIGIDFIEALDGGPLDWSTEDP